MKEVHAISNASVMKSIEAGCQTRVVPRGSVYWYMKHEGWMETHGKAAIYCMKLYLPLFSINASVDTVASQAQQVGEDTRLGRLPHAQSEGTAKGLSLDRTKGRKGMHTHAAT